MASSVLDKVREHLECPNCLDMLTDPVTLACGHSFCLGCLNGYVKTHPTAATRKFLPCSICRHETKVPRPEQPIENWGKQLTPAFTIKNLSEEIKTTPTTRNSDQCPLCPGQGKSTSAVGCNCEAGLQRRVQRQKDESSEKSELEILCPVHKKTIEFHCRECKTNACSSCRTLQHRKCLSIVPIKAVLGEMESSIAESRLTVLERQQDKNVEVNILKSQLRFIQSKEDATLLKIDDVEERMVALLRAKYREDKDEVKKTAEQEKRALQTTIEAVQQDIKVFGEHESILSQILQSRDKKNILKMHEFCQSGSLLSEDARDRPERYYVRDLDFQMHVNNVQHLMSALGQVEVTKTKDLILKLVNQVDTLAKGDKYPPRLADIVSLRIGPINAVVATDYGNNSVKCFYSKGTSLIEISCSVCHVGGVQKEQSAYSNKGTGMSVRWFGLGSWVNSDVLVGSVCHFEGGPWGIAKLGDNRVMVSLPYACQLVTLCLIPTLLIDKVIETQKGYLSLCMLDSGLMAASCHGAVDLLRVSGDTATRVRSVTDESTFTHPWYLTVNAHDNNSIIVSDYKRKKVTCLTSEGNINWSKIVTPRGVTSTIRGDVVVVDEHSRNIIVLTKSGVHKCDLLISANREIYYPMSVHCDNWGYLHIVNWECGKLLIYKMLEI